jgi:hypothetical protein
MRKHVQKAIVVIDIVLFPLVFLSAVLLKFVRRAGVKRMPLCKAMLMSVGVFPIRNHYYEPVFDKKELQELLSGGRSLPGINLNVLGQLELLDMLTFADELSDLNDEKGAQVEFSFDNSTFLSGDAEFWYQLIRRLKPKRIVEVGSGNSTLLAARAIKKNALESNGWQCEHVCIEPYEMPWLDELDVKLIRDRVEKIDLDLFKQLEGNDILFIDSSHVIRPNGDVLHEILEILPILNVGVVVHFHDIFTPRNYLSSWLVDDVRFWNEQYLLEAFLSQNDRWEVLGALNYLHHNHFERLNAVAPFLTGDREPGSFYIRKVG